MKTGQSVVCRRVSTPGAKCRFKGCLIAFSLTVALLVTAESQTQYQAVGADMRQSDPITQIDQKDETICFLKISKSPSIMLNGCFGVVIYCCDISSISLVSCNNISIQNCWIHDSAVNGVDTYRCKNISVTGCRIERVSSGLYALETSGVQFVGNYAKNMLGPFPRGQMVQFNSVYGRGNLIKDNYCINFLGQSHPEDCINMYQSQGDPDSPILIEGNYLMGDPVKGSAGKSKTGSGIMLGDNDTKGGGGGGYQVCRSNVIISAGQVGIGVAGGDAILIENNTVIGVRSEISRNGMYAWNQSNAPGGTISVTGNKVFWINRSGQSDGWWEGSGFREVRLEGNQFDDPFLVSGALPFSGARTPMPPGPVVRGKVVQFPWINSKN